MQHNGRMLRFSYDKHPHWVKTKLPTISFHFIFICSHACAKNKSKSKANFSSSLHFAYHLIFLSWHVTSIKAKKIFKLSNLMVQIKKLSWFSNKINQKIVPFFSLEIFKLCPFLNWTKRIVYTRVWDGSIHEHTKRTSKNKVVSWEIISQQTNRMKTKWNKEIDKTRLI